MTTNHHTPFAVGTELTSPNMNLPLGELDALITAMLDGSQAFSGALVGSGALDASALLTLNSTTKGFLPPRMTTAQRDAIVSPTEGLVVWNTTSQSLDYYNGATWKTIGSTGGALTELIPTTALAASTGVSLMGIAQSYQDLQLRLRIRSAQAAVTDNLAILFNNDSGGANYAWVQYYGATGTINNANDTADGAIDILCPGASATANRYLDIIFNIFNYTEGTERIHGSYHGTLADNTLYATWGTFEWVGGAALTQIDFDVLLGASFDGSYALYGLGTAE